MKALFIGLGSIGQRHLRNLKMLRPDIKLLSYRKLKESPLLSEINEVIPGGEISDFYSIKEFHNLDEALLEKPQLIFITNPSKLHLSTALNCINNDAYLFIEKPLSTSLNDIDKLRNYNKRFKKNKIAVGYQFRFHPGIVLLKEKIEELGNLISCAFVNGEYLPDWHPYEDYSKSYASRSDLGGGALLTQIHDFDLSLYFFGMPSKLFAVGSKLSSLKVDVEDSVKVLMSNPYKNKNIPISLSFDYLSWPPKRNITVTGDKGQIFLDLNNQFMEINLIKARTQRKIKFDDFNRNQLFIDEMKNFLKFSEGEEIAMVDLETSINSLKVALGAKESMEKNKIIEL